MKPHIRWEELQLHRNEVRENEDDNEGDNQQRHIIEQVLNSSIATPFGNYKSDSQMNPMNDRAVLIANTNFDLTASIIQKISEVEGVESIRVLSRYTLILMVGTLFDEELVVYKVNDICGIDADEVNFGDLTKRESDLIVKASESEFWLAYLFPNGKEFIQSFESVEELYNSVDYFKELEGFSEGRLFCSEKLEEGDLDDDEWEDDEDFTNDFE